MTHKTFEELWNEECLNIGSSKSRYAKTRARIRQAFDDREFSEILCEMYVNLKMSGQEISDAIFEKSGEKISPRSIQRNLKQIVSMRNAGEAFRNAISRNRVQWHYKAVKAASKRKMNPKLRMEILERDGKKCQICGGRDFLEVDHKKALALGGETKRENLWTLCHECNVGKALLHEER